MSALFEPMIHKIADRGFGRYIIIVPTQEKSTWCRETLQKPIEFTYAGSPHSLQLTLMVSDTKSDLYFTECVFSERFMSVLLQRTLSDNKSDVQFILAEPNKTPDVGFENLVV